MNSNRTYKVTVRLSQSEYDLIKNKADKYRISISTFMRNSSLDYQLKPPLSSEMHDVYRKLSGMSNNVNQLARKCHADGAIVLATTILQTLDELNSVISNIKQ